MKGGKLFLIFLAMGLAFVFLANNVTAECRCNECGEGWLNLCDELECNSLGSCEFQYNLWPTQDNSCECVDEDDYVEVDDYVDEDDYCDDGVCPSNCIDNDDGNDDIFAASTCVDSHRGLKEDFCEDSSSVKEAFCLWNNVVGQDICTYRPAIPCPNGCENGECLPDLPDYEITNIEYDIQTETISVDYEMRDVPSGTETYIGIDIAGSVNNRFLVSSDNRVFNHKFEFLDPLDSGQHKIIVKIDVLDTVTEIYESNNEKRINVYVESEESEGNCVDSDGMNIYSRGNVKIYALPEMDDLCSDWDCGDSDDCYKTGEWNGENQKFVNEMYCDAGAPATASYECSNGCLDGACVNACEEDSDCIDRFCIDGECVVGEPQCVDTDGGLNYKLKGKIGIFLDDKEFGGYLTSSSETLMYHNYEDTCLYDLRSGQLKSKVREFHCGEDPAYVDNPIFPIFRLGTWYGNLIYLEVTDCEIGCLDGACTDNVIECQTDSSCWLEHGTDSICYKNLCLKSCEPNEYPKCDDNFVYGCLSRADGEPGYYESYIMMCDVCEDGACVDVPEGKCIINQDCACGEVCVGDTCAFPAGPMPRCDEDLDACWGGYDCFDGECVEGPGCLFAPGNKKDNNIPIILAGFVIIGAVIGYALYKRK